MISAGCPQCGAMKTTVEDSRVGTNGIRRRRQCSSCDHRWSTIEVEIKVWNRVKGVIENRSRAGKISTDKKRGFSVPAELQPEYHRLRRKSLTAAEAAEALGIITRDQAPQRSTS